jgi:hypothetical protein
MGLSSLRVRIGLMAGGVLSMVLWKVARGLQEARLICWMLRLGVRKFEERKVSAVLRVIGVVV